MIENSESLLQVLSFFRENVYTYMRDKLKIIYILVSKSIILKLRGVGGKINA